MITKIVFWIISSLSKVNLLSAQVSIWSAPAMQEKFKKATRKWPLWEEMGKMLERAGFYGRDAKQCEALMHR